MPVVQKNAAAFWLLVTSGVWSLQSVPAVEKWAVPMRREPPKYTQPQWCFNSDPLYQAFKRGEVPLVCFKNVLSKVLLESLRSDATALRSAGFGATAGIAQAADGISDEVRRNVHQVWLQSPGQRPQEAFCGDIDARKKLLSFVSELRLDLAALPKYESLVPGGIELSYLLYKPGSFYKRHIDSPKVRDREGNVMVDKRAVSMILYLGDAHENRDWDISIDGGALRIYGNENVKCRQAQEKGEGRLQLDDYLDIVPERGTMVLFESEQVAHEVRPTERDRICVAGWFRHRSC